jgi:hypothetical protein
MRDRHIDVQGWTKAAIDSALEYGDLPDWRELFAAAARDRKVAKDILDVARDRVTDGASALAIGLIGGLWPELL